MLLRGHIGVTPDEERSLITTIPDELGMVISGDA